MRSRRTKVFRWMGLLLLSSLLLAGCAAPSATPSPKEKHPSATAAQQASVPTAAQVPHVEQQPLPPASPPPVLLSPTPGKLPAEQRFTLHFDRPLASLLVTGGASQTRPIDAEQTRWEVQLTPFVQGTTYSLGIQPTGKDGTIGDLYRFQMTTPPALHVWVNTDKMRSAGVAMPVVVVFTDTIPQQARAQVVTALHFDPAVAGAWKWQNDHQLQFTGTKWWPANTTITLTGKLAGLHGKKGGFLENDLHSQFHTGPLREIDVHLSTQTLVAKENGKVVTQFPISSGLPGHETPTGSFFIYERYEVKEMRGDNPDAPDYYDVPNVPYALYFARGGYAIHGAWWHNDFGQPMSHGCVNVPTKRFNTRWPQVPERAGWLYQWAQLGTPVIVDGHTPGA